MIKNGKITSAPFFTLWITYREYEPMELQKQGDTELKNWESSAPFIVLPQVKDKTVKERKIALKIFTDVVEEFREEALK